MMGSLDTLKSIIFKLVLVTIYILYYIYTVLSPKLHCCSYINLLKYSAYNKTQTFESSPVFGRRMENKICHSFSFQICTDFRRKVRISYKNNKHNIYKKFEVWTCHV